MTQSNLRVERLDCGLPAEQEAETTHWSWLVPFVNFWVAMPAVAFLGYGITCACFDTSSFLAPLLGPGWGVAGLLAALVVGFVSEFVVESPSLSGLDPSTRVRLAIVASSIVCANSIYLGIPIPRLGSYSARLLADQTISNA